MHAWGDQKKRHERMLGYKKELKGKGTENILKTENPFNKHNS